MPLPILHPETHRLALIYAQAVDERRGEWLEEIFTEDGVIEGGGFKIEGRAAIGKMPGGLDSAPFGKTLHCVMNHTAVVTGDTAKATTYCTAYHLLKEGPPSALIWYIRYFDDCVRVGGVWRLAYRRLSLEFTQTLPVVDGPG